jgi:transcriptional regulator GlxA family with amidase domain
MLIALVLFENLTALDAVGPYEVLSRIPGAETVFVAEKKGQYRTDTGHLALTADASFDDVRRPDIVFVPGGFGQTAYMTDGPMHEWLREVDTNTTWTTSACTGSLILAAAGLLEGRRATTHWLAVDQLPEFGAVPDDSRVVFDGKYVTAAGVSAGIDMALHLTSRMGGDGLAQAIQLGIEYDPQPPYDAGAPDKAPAHIRAAVSAQRDHILLGRPRA